MMAYDYPHPVSRTYQYKKITKPLLERKRRARINRCLDELKDLMVDALETEGENISKLEKADILELTVRHLQRLQATRASGAAGRDEVAAESRWQSGFGHCAAEACRFLSALPGEAAERLARHLAAGLQTNLRASASPKPGVPSPSLASLERTASLLSPSPTNSTSEPGATITPGTATPKRAAPYPEVACTANVRGERDPEPEAACVDRKPGDGTVDGTSSSREKRSSRCRPENGGHAVDEEEIDVERVDDGDPMWRPW